MNVPTKRVMSIRALDGPLLMLQLTEDELAGALAGSPEVEAKLEHVTESLKGGLTVEQTLRDFVAHISGDALKHDDQFLANLISKTEESVFLPHEQSSNQKSNPSTSSSYLPAKPKLW